MLFIKAQAEIHYHPNNIIITHPMKPTLVLANIPVQCYVTFINSTTFPLTIVTFLPIETVNANIDLPTSIRIDLTPSATAICPIFSHPIFPVSVTKKTRISEYAYIPYEFRIPWNVYTSTKRSYDIALQEQAESIYPDIEKREVTLTLKLLDHDTQTIVFTSDGVTHFEPQNPFCPTPPVPVEKPVEINEDPTRAIITTQTG
jgi:hypothetical protein